MEAFDRSGHLNDMTNLADLSEQTILQNLNRRYKEEIIYTYTGTILVACNPYKWIPIYEDEYVKRYNSARFGELPPHIFAIAQAAYSGLLENHSNQSVIISGESGAGKTESTKLILQYLTAVTTNQMWIEQQIMEANTILESFGNAKTVRNNNSSRFGKFMQVRFNDKKHICGATIVNYLLEKSRVAAQALDERNYHCFYQLCLGATDEEKSKYKILAPEKYNYLNQSGCIAMDSIDDVKDYEALKLALTVLNFSPDDTDHLFRLLSALLHIGNVNFNSTNNDEACKVANAGTVKIISDLLECDNAKLEDAFISRSIIVRGETSKIPLTSTAAKDSRDSVAKSVYARLFDWIVIYINDSIKPTEKTKNFIGVLDIFGFELFKVNSFEQLCINFANEKLQQFFTNYIFKLEQSEYEKEGISWSKINFVDNAECIDLFENKLGILALLDEETRFPKGTDDTFLAKINSQHEKHAYFIKPRKVSPFFGIKHYAGEVFYEIKGFLEKNRDEVSELMLAALYTSKIPLVKALTEKKKEKDDDGTKTMAKKATVAGNFKQQLMSLVQTLGETSPQYVRCIKPNSEKSAFLFEEELVLAQLRYSGMLETIRIRKAGYSVRILYDQFLERFKVLLAKFDVIPGNNSRSKVEFLLTELKVDHEHWQLGTTKIFMRNAVFVPLIALKEQFLRDKAVVMCKIIIGNYYRQLFLRKRKAMTLIQRNVKMFLAKNVYCKKRRAAITIQSGIRGWFARDFARMLRDEQLEAEDRAKKEAEEAEDRKKQEEAAKKSKEAVLAAASEEKKRKEQEEQEKQKRLQEEIEILALSREAQKAKLKAGQKGDDLGDMFSFLDISQDKPDLTAQLNDMYNVDGAKKKTDAAVQESIYTNLKKRGTTHAMKHNPLQRKLEQEAEKVPEQSKEEVYETLESYAEKHFEEHEKSSGTIGSLRKRKKYSIQEMLTYTKSAIPTSMLKLTAPNDPKRDKMIAVAVEIFRELLKITDPLNKKDEFLVPVIQNLVKLGIGVPDLRDEIIIQIVRQTSEGTKYVRNWETICLRNWQMLLICLSSFPPSKVLSRCLRAHLRGISLSDPNALEQEKEDDEDGPIEEESLQDKQQKRADLKTDVVKYAKLCEQALKQTVLNGPRKFPPSLLEIDAIRSLRPLVCRFHFLDGNAKAIGIASSTTATQAIKEIAKRIDLPDISGWSIYEVFSEDEENAIKGSDVIADVLARWELEKRNMVAETKPQSGKKGAPAVQTPTGGEVRFFMKKRLFRTPQKLPTDPVEYHLIYSQAVTSVLRGDFPLTEQVALRLASMKAQIENGDCDAYQETKIYGEELSQYLPASIIATKEKRTLQTEIIAMYNKLAGKSPLQVKVSYLEAVKQFPTYGATLFSAIYKGFWAYSNHLLIAIHVDGIFWVHPKTKNIMKSYKYDQLESWEFDVGTVIFNFKPEEDQPDTEITRLEFETKHNEELINLIKDYSPAHRVGKTKFEKVFEISEDEVSGLAGATEKARNKLLESRMLRLPGPSGNAPTGTTKSKTMTLMKNTLKMGGKEKDKDKDKKKSNDPSPSERSFYTLADWSFQKTKLALSLLDIDLADSELHENLLRMNTCILAYAGLCQAPSGYPDDENPKAPMSAMVQDLVKNCLDHPTIRDEVYLQLIKSTTSHPEPDSSTILKLWKLLSIVCWICLPSQLVYDYLRAHLRNYAYGNSSSFSKRKKEREFARYALKAVQRTHSNGGRKQPPSVDEMVAVTLMTPMYAKFNFLDGQSRSIMFDPATTTTEVLVLLKEKMAIKNCSGFSLFESFGPLERSMTAKEKVADTISKWDKFAKQTNSDKRLRLVFKRRVFMPPLDQFSNDIERNLVMHQTIYDIANDRYPVNEQEASYLAGLRCQIEVGDANSYKPDEPIYIEVVKKYIPKHLIKTTTTHVLVSSAHAKLKGKSVEDCIKLYMEHLTSWELYGSTIFNVVQTYTSSMPTNLWLAVNHEGIHILNRRSKATIFSYPYKSIVNYSPSNKNIMIMTESLTRGTKYVFNTSESSQIAHLMKDYTDAIIATKKKEVIKGKK